MSTPKISTEVVRVQPEGKASLGLDMSTKFCGAAVMGWDRRVVMYERLDLRTAPDMATKCAWIGIWMDRLIRDWDPSIVAIEAPHVGGFGRGKSRQTNPHTALSLGRVVGAALAGIGVTLNDLGVEISGNVHEVTPAAARSVSNFSADGAKSDKLKRKIVEFVNEKWDLQLISTGTTNREDHEADAVLLANWAIRTLRADSI